MSTHNQGTLSVGTGGHVVISDVPVPDMNGSDEVAYYGGHLVAESLTPDNAARVVACWNGCKGVADPAVMVPWMARTLQGYDRFAADPIMLLGVQMDCERILARLAEHPADEDESVTAGWLQSCGWVEFGLGLASVRGLFRTRLRFNREIGVTLCVPGVESEGHQMTRGELRRLCAALGVPLTEPKS